MLEDAVQRVNARVRQIELHWRGLSEKERKRMYPDLVEITGPRRELILSWARQRRRHATPSQHCRPRCASLLKNSVLSGTFMGRIWLPSSLCTA